MMKSVSEMQPVTRPLEILTLPSGSSVGPGVFIYNRFNEAQAGGSTEAHGAEAEPAEVAVDADTVASES